MATREEAGSGAPAPARERLSATPLFRRGILRATHNPFVSRTVRRFGMRLGAGRFVAGQTLDECVVALKALNAQGMKANTTLLGEGVRDEQQAEAVVREYERILDRIAVEKLRVNVALKLTHLGLDLGEETAYRNVERLVRHAAGHGNFIRIDMEESARVDATLRIYRRLREAGHDNVGTVLQSYLYRTPRDLEELIPLKPNLRLVKGAYLESPEIAFPRKTDVDAAFTKIAERALQQIAYTAIATHDERIIEHLIAFAKRNEIPNDRYEFQMLYGIRAGLQRSLVARGYAVLIATPFGPEWYFYLMRRLAERPANLLFFGKNLIKR